MDKLRQALQALESCLCDPEGNVCWGSNYADRDVIGEGLDILRALSDQVEQYPVGYTDSSGTAYAIRWTGKLPPNLTLYAAPVRTKDMTDDEIDEIFEVNRTVGRLFQRDFARAVIAKFKEKNK